MKPNPQLQAALASHQAGREARGPGTGAGVASHALDAIGYILEYLDASERRGGGEGGDATALARDIVHAYQTDPDDDEQRDVNLENRIASALRNAGRKDSDLLPTDPEDERIVDELVARRKAGLKASPISKSETPPDPGEGDGEEQLRDFYDHYLAGWVDKDWEDLDEDDRSDVRLTLERGKAIGAEDAEPRLAKLRCAYSAACYDREQFKNRVDELDANEEELKEKLAAAEAALRADRSMYAGKLKEAESAREEAERKVRDLQRLWDVVAAWRDKYKPLCAESCWQTDRCSIAAPELTEAACEVVGWASLDDEEEPIPSRCE